MCAEPSRAEEDRRSSCACEVIDLRGYPGERGTGDISPDGGRQLVSEFSQSSSTLALPRLFSNHHHPGSSLVSTMHVIPSLNMANILANDAPLLSPSTADWDHARFSPSAALDGFGLEMQYPLSPTPSHAMSTTSSQQQSPIPAAMMLRGRLSPDYSDSDQQMCVPTHQVFDYTPAPVTPAAHAETPEPTSRMLTGDAPPSVVPAKRPSSVAPSCSSKKRATERVSTKDFIPPDVTGLSKREARLVKNRAAAFLSRQRKREEFENMEMYAFFLFFSFLSNCFFFEFPAHSIPLSTLRIQRIPMGPGPSISNCSRWSSHHLALRR